MNLNNAGKQLIKTDEGCKLVAYLCPAKIPTIGYGNTFYEDGTPVRLGDTITQQRADNLFEHTVEDFADKVRLLIRKPITDNQFSALVSFAYNAGVGSLKASRLLLKVNANPIDTAIRNEFMKWVNGGGKVLTGLVRRRKEEANLYFTP